jgi:hypothetical protein
VSLVDAFDDITCSCPLLFLSLHFFQLLSLDGSPFGQRLSEGRSSLEIILPQSFGSQKTVDSSAGENIYHLEPTQGSKRLVLGFRHIFFLLSPKKTERQ